MPVDRGTLPRVDPRQVGAVGGRDRRADRTVALSYTGALTQTACWEGRSQVCDEIRLTLAEVRRRTPSAVPAWGPRGTTPRLTVRGTAAGAPPPPPPPPVFSGRWNSCNALPHCVGAVGCGTHAIHRRTPCGQWAVELLQCIATLPLGSKLWNSRNTPPQCLWAMGIGTPAMHGGTSWGAMGSGIPAMHRHTACGQWPVELVQCTATLHVGSGRWNSCNALPHYMSAMTRGTRAMHRHTALDIYTRAMHRHAPWGQWALEFMKCIATLPVCSGQWNSYNALPHYLGAMGTGPTPMHCHTACGHWAVECVPCTATVPCGNGKWNSCNPQPHYLWAVGNGTPAMHCHSACGQWAVKLLQCTAGFPGGSKQWNSCNAPQQCLWAVRCGICGMHCHTALDLGKGTRAMHCHTACGQWAVELLQCTAHCPGAVGSSMRCHTARQSNSCNALPHRLGGVGVELLQFAATLPMCSWR